MNSHLCHFADFLSFHVDPGTLLRRVLGWLLVFGLATQIVSHAAFGQTEGQVNASGHQGTDTTTIIVNNPPERHLHARRRAVTPPKTDPAPVSHPKCLTVSVNLHGEPKKADPKTDWLGWVWKALPLLGLALLFGWGLFAWWLPARRNEERPVWFVWSIRDEVGAGAAGAVIEALDVTANPLVAPYVQPDYRKRKEARARRELLLLPPFLEHSAFRDDSIFRGGSTRTNGVLKDFLGSGFPLTFVEKIVFFPDEKNRTEGASRDLLPVFRLDEAYGEVNLKVGGFEMRGIMGLVTLYKRVKFRNFHNVLGFISKGEGKGWSVRLNGQIPALRAGAGSEFVASVWADTIDTDFGDPLGLVAQRAAFKLLLRIVDNSLCRAAEAKGEKRARYDTNSIHAIANFRQGIDQLLQLL